MSEKDLDIAIEKCERIMEFDTRTLKDPESENGWIFEKVYDLLMFLRQLEFATDTNVATTDTISRQAMINEINLHVGILYDSPTLVESLKTLVKALPSAQPVNIAKLQPNCNQVASDCISRAAAIEIMRKSKDKSEAHRMLLQLPSAQPGWIPCDRELPRPNEEDGNGFYKAYLVQDGRWMDVARWDGKYWVAWGYSTVLLNVVAWMPLPTPYREGGQDNGKT